MTCEAETRNTQALYLLENEWGCGKIDVPKLQRLLRGNGDGCGCTHQDHEQEQSA